MKTPLLTLAVCLSMASVRAQTVDFDREFPVRTIFSWKPGMRFVMPAGAGGFNDCPLMVLKGPTFKGTDLYGVSPDDKALVGTTFTFQRLDAFKDLGYDNKSGSGAEKVAVVFKAANGKQYAHILNYSLAEVKQQATPVGAPCLVSLDQVEKARQALVGKTLYVRQQYPKAGSTRDDVQYLPKFVPVKITKVSAGSGRRPVKVAFEYVGLSPRQTQEHEYVFGSINDARATVGGETVAEYFLNCFSFDDPRAKAGAVKTANWKAIQQGVLVKGMTMQEVEQVMGKPKRRAERMEEERLTLWYYSRFQGKQWELLFKNGVLERYDSYQD